MQRRKKISLSILLALALLSLISCTAKSNTIEPPIILSSTPSPSAVPTLIYPTATYTITPTEIPFSIPNGRLLFVGESITNDVDSNGLILWKPGTNESILIVDKDQELTGQTISLSYPNITWSTDGHWIAFVGTDFSKPFWLYAYEDIYLVKSDGTELRRLTYSPHYNKRDIAWSPDGKYILAAMGINGSDLYLIDAVNGEIVERLTSSGNNYVAVWSPYGDKIAYLENSALSIMNVADEASQQLNIPSNYHVLGISWSPSNDQIAFVSAVDNSKCGDIFIVNVDTGEIKNLTSSDILSRITHASKIRR